MPSQRLFFRIKNLLPILLLIAGFSACRQSPRQAEPMPPEAQQYVYAFTSGVISSTDPVRIRFTQPVTDAENAGTAAPANLLSFAPGIDGSFQWEDERTLRFDPGEPLPSGTAYVASVNLKKIIPGVPDAAGRFEFGFQTRNQFVTVEVDGLYATDIQNPAVQELRGRLLTADFAKAAATEKVLEATQNGTSLDISWNHSADGMEHAFTVSGVQRKETAASLTVAWNGRPLGVDLQEERQIAVPALGDFKVMSARVVPEQTPYLLVHFSEPLQENQQLEGLVTVDGYPGNLRFLIDGQELRIYPTQPVAGEVRLVFNPGIRNLQGQRMTNASDWRLTIVEAKPQVRLVGKGVILPDSEGLLFPFEAIGLTAVDIEVFKIFNNNILQFLQSNPLDGNNQLREVGRIIRREKIDLRRLNPAASTTEWTRYALDLRNLIEQDPEAIFQIRIGFQPAYAVYQCENQATTGNNENMEVADPFRETGDQETFMDDWYGSQGYYLGYNWDHRDNPCYPAYYNSDRFVARNVLSSNLGIIAKGSDNNHFFAAVTDLRTTQGVSNATLDFYDYQQQLLLTAQTDSRGLVQVDLPRTPYVITARHQNQRGYLPLRDGEALTVSQFNVEGAVTQQGLKGFLYADRGVWRPGDSVFLNFILDDRYGKLPANYPVTFELTDPRGTLQERRVAGRSTGNIYPLYFRTHPDDPTGNWIARVKAGGAAFEKIIKIETVRPNRLSIDLDFGGDALYAGKGPVEGQLAVKWLHGAPARGLRTEVEVDLKPVASNFEKFQGFVFEDPARKTDFESRTIFDGTLNAEGRATFEADLLNQENAPGQLGADFRIRAYEPGGAFSTSYESLPYHPYAAYAGIRLPENEYGTAAVEIDQPAAIDFAVTTPQGQPVANRQLSVGVYRLEWRWWWDRGSDNVSRFNTSDHLNAVRKTESLTTNAQGKVQWETSFNEWGRYLVRVCDAETGHCAGDFLYVGGPGYGDGNDVSRQAAAMLNFEADKEKYAVGETASLTIPTGKEGRALITLENGTKVVESYWIDAKDGKNTFSFEVTEAMHPTIYAHVALLQPHAQVLNDLPIRMYGVIPIEVEDPATILEPTLEMPETLEPEQTFSIAVAEEEGRPMAYTIAVVDEGLLGLTGFNTPDPHGSIYAREALGVRTWDVYDQVLGAFGEQMERVMTVGGDAAVRVNPASQRANRFDPVVLHLGPFFLEKGKTATHQLKMPNYVGAVRAMVVAANQGAYGSADRQVPVQQPLMVLATLPRVLSPGERVQLPVTVFAMDENVRQVNLTVKESSGLVRWTGGTGKSVAFAKPGEQVVPFEFEVDEQTGVARFTVEASGGGAKAAQTIEIQVRNPNPVQTKFYSQVLDPGQDWSTSFAAIGMEGTNEGILEVSNLPPLNLGERLNYLLTYPYGCVEQTLSSGFPQLYVHRLLNLSDAEEKKATANVQATIDRLRQFQTAQGGFAYWPGNANPDQWSTNYGGHFLLEAQNMGYTIPPGLLDRWLDFQKRAARMWSPQMSQYGYGNPSADQLNQAYRLYTMALAQAPDMAAMNRLRETAALSLQSRWRLAAAYALAGKKEVGSELVNQAATSVEPYRELSGTFGSSTRDQAMILETLLLLEREDDAMRLMQDLSATLSAGRWLSTQTIAYSLLAVSKLVGQEDVQDNFGFTYTFNGSQPVNAGSENPVMQVSIPVKADGQNQLNVKNSSQGKLFARLIQRGQPVTGAEQDAAENLNINVVYKSKEGKTIDPASLLQGTDFYAEVTVSHRNGLPIPYEELALSQIFPSGWEILNTRVGDFESDQAASSSYEFQDIRDDRVNTFFDLRQGASHTYRVQLNAAYSGRFYLPATACEAMYDAGIYARKAGRWVEVRRAENL